LRSSWKRILNQDEYRFLSGGEIFRRMGDGRSVALPPFPRPDIRAAALALEWRRSRALAEGGECTCNHVEQERRMTQIDGGESIIGPHDPILITGATGFIGQRVTQNLINRGFRNLRCIARPSSDVTRTRDDGS
jgi:hypothetical protein